MMIKKILKWKFISIFRKNISFFSRIINCSIDKDSVIRCGNRIYDSKINKFTYINKNCLIQNTSIGGFCSISENCKIGLPNHDMTRISTSPVFFCGKNYFNTNIYDYPPLKTQPTIIGNDVWLGIDVKIISGVVVGNGSVVGTGSVVTKNIPDYEIWAGIPAKKIGVRFDQVKIQKFLSLKWWDLDLNEIINEIKKLDDKKNDI